MLCGEIVLVVNGIVALRLSNPRSSEPGCGSQSQRDGPVQDDSHSSDMFANPSYISFKQLSRIAFPVTSVSTLSVTLVLLSSGTLVLKSAFSPALFPTPLPLASDFAGVLAGLPLFPAFLSPVPAAAFVLTSRRHFATHSAAARATSGVLCTLYLFTVMPILVVRRRSSVAVTVVRSCVRIDSMTSVGSEAETAFTRSAPRRWTSLGSRDMVKVCLARYSQKPVSVVAWDGQRFEVSTDEKICQSILCRERLKVYDTLE